MFFIYLFIFFFSQRTENQGCKTVFAQANAGGLGRAGVRNHNTRLVACRLLSPDRARSLGARSIIPAQRKGLLCTLWMRASNANLISLLFRGDLIVYSRLFIVFQKYLIESFVLLHSVLPVFYKSPGLFALAVKERSSRIL